DILSGFESIVQGLTPESQKQLLAGALFARVNAQIALGQLDQATASLVGLLEKSRVDDGIRLVHDLLAQLDKQYEKADLANDTERMRAVAGNEAKLTGFLSKWARDSTEPKVHSFAYAY